MVFARKGLGWVVGLGLILAGCGGTKEGYVERPVEGLYNTAMDQLYDKEYDQAAKTFDEVDRQHPYSVWATKAQIMSAYVLYEAAKYGESVVAADRFIQLHPGHRDVAYAYYLKALDYYVQIADVGRDQKVTDQALAALAEVVRRFPDTKYARDARLKIDLARDHLAGKEMEIGRYYERRGFYLAAVNRFRRVTDVYQTTTHVPEALHRLTECYLALGLTDEAHRTAAVLGYNYAGSEWYRQTYSLMTGEEKPASTAALPANPSPKSPKPGQTSSGWTGRLVGSAF
ncbi:MAG TPA: outer membrane protein assembly factor BamD [Stellaceae bacterium]|nr:outer membrane protein assembly factor BamD [Stellaceae bacterium]